MRVFLLTSHPVAPPWNSGDKELARALVEEASTTVFSLIGDRSDPVPWPEQHRVARLPFRSDMPTNREKLRILGWLFRHPQEVDLVHSLVTFQPGVAAQRALTSLRWLRQRPLVITCTTGVFLPWQLLRRAEAVVAMSRQTEWELRDGGVDNVHLISPGVNLDHYFPGPADEAQAALGLDPMPTLFFAGHHDPGGGLDNLMETAALLRRRVGPVRILVAMRTRPGQNRARLHSRMLARAGALGIELVDLGPYANMPMALRAASAVVHQPDTASLKMDLPLSLIEALASGRPVVVSGVGSLVELGDGGPAVLAAPPLHSLAITHLERVILDPNYAAACEQAARQLAEQRYSDRRMRAAYHQVYQQVV